MGEMAAVGVLAADRHRSRTGMGSLVKLALSDVALAMVANLGRLAQAELGHGAKKDGNYLYGAFGRDFVTSDGRRVMVMALTERQWKVLQQATGIEAAALADSDGRRPRHGGRALRGARRDQRSAHSLVRCTKLRRCAGAFSQAPTCRGDPTRPSSNSRPRIRDARRETQCSRRWIIPASGCCSRRPPRSISRRPNAFRPHARRCLASTPMRYWPGSASAKARSGGCTTGDRRRRGPAISRAMVIAAADRLNSRTISCGAMSITTSCGSCRGSWHRVLSPPVRPSR